MEFTKEECLLIYCISKPYYTTLLKEHWTEHEEHGPDTALYKNQEEEMKEIIKLQKKLQKIGGW